VAVAAWYTKHLGLKVVRTVKDAARTHFLADSSGTVMLEVYNNPPDQVPPYAKMDPLLIHIAFVSKDPEVDKTALLAAGATLVVDQRLDDGSHLVMLRDPWGLAIQLCKRATPMLTAG
jgi:catechol 2,3-dioxygenase-like lactoylglutathione lyase family enzyme